MNTTADNAATPPAGDAETAIALFLEKTGARAAAYLDACIRCGACANACHYYQASGDPRHAPVNKFRMLEKAYRRHKDPWAWLKRLSGFAPADPDIGDMQEWQELVYDTCSMCGRCTLACPMGIDIAQLVAITRAGLTAAGLAPEPIRSMAAAARDVGSPLGIDAAQLRDILNELSEKHGVPIPLDKEKADVLLIDSSLDYKVFQPTLVAMAKILDALGIDWTFSSKGYEASNLGLFTGQEDVAKAMVERIVTAAEDVGASLVLAPECGHGYASIRWEAANILGRELPFEVLHISEYLARLHREGRFGLRPLDHPITYHDPCKLGRRGGVIEEPRDILRDLAPDYREMEPSGVENWCCGGGGGVLLLESAAKTRLEAFRIKMDQVERTGAEGVVMACAFCHHTFDNGAEHFNWDRKVEDLVQLVAEHMILPGNGAATGHPAGH